MATLRGRDARGATLFALSPLASANPGEDGCEYAVELASEPGGIAVTRRFSVAGWDSAHERIWLLARTFQMVPEIAGVRAAPDLWDIGWGEPVTVYQNAYWLRVVIWSPHPRLGAAVQLYVQEDEGGELFRSFFLRCGLAEAMAFGKQLEDEIEMAAPGWAAEKRASRAAHRLAREERTE